MTTCDTLKQFFRVNRKKPFQVVLVDIEKAAKDEIIHCVEKPLHGDTEKLSFVALSYRWGELQEQLIDTRLDYIASITSFDLKDFYRLCQMMMKEPDLESIKYVWVDAICVDQTNYERRKATIHQMSNIYERATYILAVPDLHLRHLRNVSQANMNVIRKLQEYPEYIYHLIQGGNEKLTQLDNAFLDKINVPGDHLLRQLLTKYSRYFMDDISRDGEWPSDFDAEVFVEELYYISQTDSLINDHPCSPDAAAGKTKTKKQIQTYLYADFETLYSRFPYVGRGHRWQHCYAWFDKRDKDGGLTLPWKNYVIRRNNDIAQAMAFLGNLVKDWSSRVWVISEYHIAKEKNNLKYWFIGLNTLEGLPFFKFDFGDAGLSWDIKRRIYRQFHIDLIRQLETKTFFDKILSSKASKIEDRFYAILPQSKYKDKINQVAHWKINTMLAVKLKLFEIMDIKDKLILLFSAGKCHFSLNSPHILPTFATLTIETHMDCNFDNGHQLNFDLLNKSTITIHHHAHDSHLYHYLQLTPKRYYILREPHHEDILRYTNMQKETLCRHFQFDDQSLKISVVRLNLFKSFSLSSNYIYLTGSFSKNKWILGFTPSFQFIDNLWLNDDNDDTATVFNIY